MGSGSSKPAGSHKHKLAKGFFEMVFLAVGPAIDSQNCFNKALADGFYDVASCSALFSVWRLACLLRVSGFQAPTSEL